MAADLVLQFPNLDRGERMVLYPLSGGGVALEWELPPGLIERALNAFPLLEPIPMLYLRRADGSGVRLAAADLSEHPAGAQSGHARFETPVVGSLQAELGLEGRRDGGWLLLSRSNRLDAVPQGNGLPGREEDVVRASAPQATAAETEARRSATGSDRPSPQQGLSLSLGAAAKPVSTCRLPPVPEPVQAKEESAPQAAASSRGAAREAVAAIAEQAAPEGSTARDLLAEDDIAHRPTLPAAVVWQVVASRYPDPSLTSVLRGPLRLGRMFPRITVLRRQAWPSSPSAGSALSPAERSQEQRLGADSRAAVAVAGERNHPTSHDGLDEPDARRQDISGFGSSAGRGSGPLAPYPSPDPPLIRGELRVFGRAAPWATLDLGGHRFRVGPGGRFSFAIALDDPALLASLLARLPGLPVAERDA